jgi:hypothetical protein
MHADRICISTSPRPAFEPTLHGWPQPLGLAAPGVIGSPVIPPRPTPRTEGGLYRLGLATTRPGDAIKRQVVHHPLHHPRRDLWVFLDEFGR